jgi:hypothetical protein
MIVLVDPTPLKPPGTVPFMERATEPDGRKPPEDEDTA